eukprot:g17586.t1
MLLLRRHLRPIWPELKQISGWLQRCLPEVDHPFWCRFRSFQQLSLELQTLTELLQAVTSHKVSVPIQMLQRAADAHRRLTQELKLLQELRRLWDESADLEAPPATAMRTMRKSVAGGGGGGIRRVCECWVVTREHARVGAFGAAMTERIEDLPMTSSEHLNIELDSDGFLEFVSEEAEDARSDLSSWNLVTSDLGGEDWFPVGDDDESPASTGLSGGGTPTAQFLRGEGEGDEGDEALISVEGGLKEVEVIPAPEKTLKTLVGPLTIDGVDFSAVSFLLGEWVDSLGHCVSVVARDEQSAKARISWDHKNQKKTKLWKTFLKIYREEGRWICGNGRLLSADVGRVQWQREDGRCTEWIRTLPASRAFLSAYVRPCAQ